MHPTINRIIYEWGVRCFGIKHMSDPRARALRLVEEAIELAQAVDVPQLQVQRTLEVVYNRHAGDPAQELGGVFVTAIVMSQCLRFSPEEIIEREVCRCLSKRPEEFSARNREKNALGLTG